MAGRADNLHVSGHAYQVTLVVMVVVVWCWRTMMSKRRTAAATLKAQSSSFGLDDASNSSNPDRSTKVAAALEMLSPGGWLPP